MSSQDPHRNADEGFGVREVQKIKARRLLCALPTEARLAVLSLLRARTPAGASTRARADRAGPDRLA